MSKMKRYFAAVVVCCLVLTMSSCGTEPTYVDMTISRANMEICLVHPPEVYTLQQLTSEASVIVLADVNGIFYDENNMLMAELTVKETWKGTTDKTVNAGTVRKDPTQSEVSDPNDTAAEATAAGEPIMRRGNRVVLFLEKDDDASYYNLCGDTAGKFFYDEDGTYHNCLMYSPQYQTYINEDVGRIDSDYLSLDEMPPKTNRELRRIVKDAL